MVQPELSSFTPTEVILTHERKRLETRSEAENSDIAAGLPVPMGYDCVYDSAPVILLLSDTGSSSSSSRM